MPTARTLARRTAYEVVTLTSPHPGLALPAARFWGHGEPLAPDTDIVIEGYPRSGNSQAFGAFAGAQARTIRIAHHTHTAANAIAGARKGLPVLVLMREPDDAITEMVLIKPEITVAQAMRGYRRFYAPLLGFRDRIVVGRFEDVIHDFESVVRRINERFGTAFASPASSAEGAALSDVLVERYWRERSGRGLPIIGRDARGSTMGGEEARSRIEAMYLARASAPLRRQLADLYERFTAERG